MGLLQGPEFLEHRRLGLERFLRKVVEHDELKNTNFFKSFLECSPVELTAIKAESRDAAPSAMGAVTQKTQALNSWWGKAYQRMTENEKVKLLAAKAGRDISSSTTIEDPEFDRVLKYVGELFAHVKSLQAKAQNAHRQNKLSAGAYCELIECMSSVADIEDTFSDMQTSDFSAVLSLLDTRARQIDAELAMFSSSVDDFARWVGAVVNAVNVREDRRFVYQAKLAAKNKTAASGAGSGNTTADAVDAKEEFERVHSRVMSEIERFRAEKATELRKLFMDFAALQARTTAEMSAVVTSSTEMLATPLADRMAAIRFKSSFSLPNPGEHKRRPSEIEEMLLNMSVHSNSPDAAGEKSAASEVDPANAAGVPYADVSL